MIGNGQCNDEVNNEECNYDGGDCCLYEVIEDYCIHCSCRHQPMCIAGNNPFVGDGFCNDETNNANCNYDGGDCCLSDVIKDHCYGNFSGGVFE